MIYAETNIPCCQQVLSGWPTNHFPSGEDSFSKFNLPDRFKLNVTLKNADETAEWIGVYEILV